MDFALEKIKNCQIFQSNLKAGDKIKKIIKIFLVMILNLYINNERNIFHNHWIFKLFISSNL